MKGVRFYLQHDTPRDKRKGKHNGNVFAAFYENKFFSRLWLVEGVGAVFYTPNSAVAGTSAAIEYLDSNCKRISEAKAREIHPALFAYLDANTEGK